MMPINGTAGGVVNSFMEHIEWMRFEQPKDYELYLYRLVDFHHQIEQFILAMREGE